ncbi:ABC transporter substrate-binding protein [Microlunatus sp. GCM10028923]|uniref:ABC transporter substrate-binding protein n=1 Tax=Microlunatus sp. GCM10028923 TaxID=3273400 RepID=UPI003610A447
MSTRKGANAIASAVVLALLTACGGGAANDPDNAIHGEISGDITVVTWRTDLVEDGTFEKYAGEFRKLHPNVRIEFEGITNYEGEMATRLSTKNYGDVIGIPTMHPRQFEQFLEPLGETSELAGRYRFTSSHTYGGKQYGLAIGGNASGIVYNKRVFEEAGITDLPTNGTEWIDALKKVKDSTAAVPYYTNYKDGWPLGEAYSNLGAITKDPDAGIRMAENPAPWTEGTDIYAIDSFTYDMVAAGLTEDDPLTTNWEQSKVELGTGKIAAMGLGSWAISQIKDAAEANGASADDIGYLAFPSSVDGTQYSMIEGDYNLGVSRHSQHKAAAWAFIRWLVEESGFTEDEGMVSTVNRKPLPANLRELDDRGIEFMEASPAPAGEESLLRDVADEAKIDLSGYLYRQKLLDVARGAAEGDKESFFADLNQRWNQAIETVTG